MDRIATPEGVLVGRAAGVGEDAPVVDQLVTVERVQDGVGVARVYRDEHQTAPAGLGPAPAGRRVDRDGRFGQPGDDLVESIPSYAE